MYSKKRVEFSDICICKNCKHNEKDKNLQICKNRNAVIFKEDSETCAGFEQLSTNKSLINFLKSRLKGNNICQVIVLDQNTENEVEQLLLKNTFCIKYTGYFVYFFHLNNGEQLNDVVYDNFFPKIIFTTSQDKIILKDFKSLELNELEYYDYPVQKIDKDVLTKLFNLRCYV